MPLTVPLNFQGKGKEWAAMDLPTTLQPLLRSGYGFDRATGMLKPLNPASGWDTPWIYTKSIDNKFCTLDHNVKFNNFRYIPPRCLQCWKVVVSLKKYTDLDKLLEIERSMDVPCKAGIEVRMYTPKNYGGYFYNRSLDEGRERYEQVKKAVDEHIEDATVILKRGCTEYEVTVGPSPFWVMPDGMRELDELIEVYVDRMSALNGRQTEVQKAHVRKRWIVWAHSIGDMSYLKDNGGVPLVEKPVTYHDGDIEGVKNELAMAEAYNMAKNSGKEVDPDALMQFREMTRDASTELGVNPSILRQATSYLSFPKELVGDADQTT